METYTTITIVDNDAQRVFEVHSELVEGREFYTVVIKEPNQDPLAVPFSLDFAIRLAENLQRAETMNEIMAKYGAEPFYNGKVQLAATKPDTRVLFTASQMIEVLAACAKLPSPE